MIQTDNNFTKKERQLSRRGPDRNINYVLQNFNPKIEICKKNNNKNRNDSLTKIKQNRLNRTFSTVCFTAVTVMPGLSRLTYRLDPFIIYTTVITCVWASICYYHHRHRQINCNACSQPASQCSVTHK